MDNSLFTEENIPKIIEFMKELSETNYELFISTKKSINDITTEPSQQEKISQALDNELNELYEWQKSVGRNDHSVYFSFDKDNIMTHLTPEIINNEDNWFIDTFTFYYNEVIGEFYSVFSSARDDEQIEELNELALFIYNKIDDEDRKRDFNDAVNGVV